MQKFKKGVALRRSSPKFTRVRPLRNKANLDFEKAFGNQGEALSSGFILSSTGKVK